MRKAATVGAGRHLRCIAPRRSAFVAMFSSVRRAIPQLMRVRRRAALALTAVMASALSPPGAVGAGPAQKDVPSATSNPDAQAADAHSEATTAPPRLAIVIDDLGYGFEAGRAAIAIDAPLSFAILPHTPHGKRLARLARRRDRTVLVHLPMQAEHGNHRLGAGALMLDMDKATFLAHLAANLAAVPGAIGVNNHMGSVLTRHPEPMRWLFEGLEHHGVATFVDSRTTHLTVAGDVSRRHPLTYLERDVFLDNVRDEAAIAARLEEAAVIAELKGSAIAIGHPHPETTRVLATRLPALTRRGIELVGIATLSAMHALPAPNALARGDAAFSKDSPTCAPASC